MILRTAFTVGMLCLMLTGCSGPAPVETQPPTDVPAETVPLAAENVPREAAPLSAVRAASPEAFAEAGIPLTEPFGAESVVYEWDGEVAQIRFTMQGVEQVFRGGRDQSAVERDYPQTEESVTICACGAYYSQTTEKRTYEDGSTAALWSFGDLYFSLYTAPHGEESSGASSFTLGEYVANRLDERTWPGTMGADDKFFPEQTDAELILTDVTAWGLTLGVQNHRGDELTYGGSYVLWKLVGDDWRQLPYCKPENGQVGDMLMLYRQDAAQTLEWYHLYGKLAPDSYRVTKEVFWGSGENREGSTVYADFTIE